MTYQELKALSPVEILAHIYALETEHEIALIQDAVLADDSETKVAGAGYLTLETFIMNCTRGAGYSKGFGQYCITDEAKAREDAYRAYRKANPEVSVKAALRKFNLI